MNGFGHPCPKICQTGNWHTHLALLLPNAYSINLSDYCRQLALVPLVGRGSCQCLPYVVTTDTFPILVSIQGPPDPPFRFFRRFFRLW